MLSRVEEDPRPLEKPFKVSPSIRLMLCSTLHCQGKMIVYPDVSGYIPDFHAFFNFLQKMQTLNLDNEDFNRLVPGYFSLTTTIYYAILLLFQIARTRKYLGIASRSESQFARRFEREFPLESLPVAGPLVGFFEILGSIVSLQGYGPVSPNLIDFHQFDTVGSFAAIINGKCRLPPLPLLIKLWTDIRTGTDIRTKPQDLLFWTPGLTKLGINFADPASYGLLAISPAWTEPLCNISITDDLSSLRTRLWRMPSPPDMATLTFNSVGNFCGLSDSTQWKWFNGFKQIAVAEASFFNSSTNMSTISTYGTLAFLVETQTTFYYTPKDYSMNEISDAPFYNNEDLPTSNNLSALSRIGDEYDFRLGIASSYCIHYQNITDQYQYRETLTLKR
ncbi:hypothetical protein Golomagni_04682 [Golovinomyces magnicellulatus]|nr:hypothetical protein Golomagni_04682 [Golovinomyces magnicellulatus]